MAKVPNYRQRPPSHIEATARAWNISVSEMYRIWVWLEQMPRSQRWAALRTILRNNYKEK